MASPRDFMMPTETEMAGPSPMSVAAKGLTSTFERGVGRIREQTKYEQQQAEYNRLQELMENEEEAKQKLIVQLTTDPRGQELFSYSPLSSIGAESLKGLKFQQLLDLTADAYKNKLTKDKEAKSEEARAVVGEAAQYGDTTEFAKQAGKVAGVEGSGFAAVGSLLSKSEAAAMRKRIADAKDAIERAKIGLRKAQLANDTEKIRLYKNDITKYFNMYTNAVDDAEDNHRAAVQEEMKAKVIYDEARKKLDRGIGSKSEYDAALDAWSKAVAASQALRDRVNEERAERAKFREENKELLLSPGDESVEFSTSTSSPAGEGTGTKSTASGTKYRIKAAR